MSLKDDSLKEGYWQKFFTQHSWIFGYGLNYQFLSIESDQPTYGGVDYTGRGAQRGDYLMSTSSENSKFTVLLEIKKPSTLLLAKMPRNGDNIRYRNGAWLLGSKVLGGVSQLKVNCNTWEQSSKDIVNRKLIESGISTARPKGILLIGNTSELADDLEKTKSFELFRQGLSSIEVLTFDELLERAKFIVRNENSSNADSANEDVADEETNLPF